MSKCSPPHWIAIKRIMRYLKGTLDFKLCLRCKDIVLRGFCNVDWTGDANDRRSTIQYVFLIGVGVIVRKCKTQAIIILSMTKEKYMATSHCTNEAAWLRSFLADVGHVQKRPTSIMCNNHGCITLAKNVTHHSRTKHINVKYHFIGEKLENQELCLKYCPMEDMITDILTKALANDRYQALTNAMALKAFNYLESESVEDRALDCS